MMFVVLIQWKIQDQLPSGSNTIERGKWNAACTHDWWQMVLLVHNLYDTPHHHATHANGGTPTCMGHLCMSYVLHIRKHITL